MSEMRALARAEKLEPQTMDDVARLAKIAAASGLAKVRSPEEAAIILMTGYSLGLNSMQSLRGIYVVEGRPVLSADLLVAVARQSGLCALWRIDESTAKQCRITTHRKGDESPVEKVWTMDDAARAGLASRPIWRNYPAQMLRHRCAADIVREVYPDVVMGLYTPDEMGAPETVSGDLDVVVRQETARREPAVFDAPQLPAESASDDEPHGALAAFAADLRDCSTLRDVAACWRVHNAALHREGRADDAGAEVGDWLDVRSHEFVASDQTALLAGTLPDDALAWLDALPKCADFDAVVVHLTKAPPGDKRVTPILWTNAARRAVRVDGGTCKPAEVTAAGKRLKAAVKALQPPPDGTHGPARETDAHVAAEGAGEAASESNAAQPQALAAVPAWAASDEGIRDHLAGKGARKALENSVRFHGRVCGRRYLDLAAERLEALMQPDAHGTRPAAGSYATTVQRWADEGPLTSQVAPKAGAKLAALGIEQPGRGGKAAA